MIDLVKNKKYLATCNSCLAIRDFKSKSRFNRVKLDSYLCSTCKKDILLKNRTRVCPNCDEITIYKSPGNKRQCDKFAFCKKCKSNNIPKMFSDKQSEFINGLMLGDGSIIYSHKRGSLFPRLSVTRQIKDKDYLYFQYELFKDFYKTPPKYFKSFHKRVKKFYEGYGCITLTGQVFKDLHELWYPQKKKIVPHNLKLTPLTILIWFLDDGCIIKTSKNGLLIQFSTDGFPKEDVEFLVKLLCNYTGEKFYISKNGNGYRIRGTTLATIKIIEIIDPILPICMERKRTWKDFDFNFVKNSNAFGPFI